MVLRPPAMDSYWLHPALALLVALPRGPASLAENPLLLWEDPHQVLHLYDVTKRPNAHILQIRFIKLTIKLFVLELQLTTYDCISCACVLLQCDYIQSGYGTVSVIEIMSYLIPEQI